MSDNDKIIYQLIKDTHNLCSKMLERQSKLEQKQEILFAMVTKLEMEVNPKCVTQNQEQNLKKD